MHKISRKLLDGLFPPRCLACSELTHSHGTFCATCHQGLEYLDPEGEAQLGAERPYAYGTTYSVLEYNDIAHALITRLKYADHTELATPLGALLAEHGKWLAEKSTLIIPVPLARTRLLSRRYNQSLLLAKIVAKHYHKPLALNSLLRIRRTIPQVGLSRAERERNVKDAFAIHPKAKLENMRILLVDDVITTGATTLACAKALIDAGAKRVDALSLAKTPPPA